MLEKSDPARTLIVVTESGRGPVGRSYAEHQRSAADSRTTNDQPTKGIYEKLAALESDAVPTLCPNFLFVSGIANRLGYFNSELSHGPYAQNFATSHNAGITMAWLLPRIMPRINWVDVWPRTPIARSGYGLD